VAPPHAHARSTGPARHRCTTLVGGRRDRTSNWRFSCCRPALDRTGPAARGWRRPIWLTICLGVQAVRWGTASCRFVLGRFALEGEGALEVGPALGQTLALAVTIDGIVLIKSVGPSSARPFRAPAEDRRFKKSVRGMREGRSEHAELPRCCRLRVAAGPAGVRVDPNEGRARWGRAGIGRSMNVGRRL